MRGTCPALTGSGLFDDFEAVSADPEFHEFVCGSSRVALDLLDRFSRYVFVERDPGRAFELLRFRQEYGEGYKIEVFNGEAADALDMLLAGDLGQPSIWRSRSSIPSGCRCGGR